MLTQLGKRMWHKVGHSWGRVDTESGHGESDGQLGPKPEAGLKPKGGAKARGEGKARGRAAKPGAGRQSQGQGHNRKGPKAWLGPGPRPWLGESQDWK